MELDNGQVWLSKEKISLPKNQSFIITVGFLGLKSLGTSKRQFGDTEELGTSVSGQISVDIFGRDFDVITRKEEIIQAMASTYSKEMQSKYGFLIAENPTTINDISELDGPAIPYRFQYTFGVQFFAKKTKTLDYYDNFTKELYYDHA